MNMLFKPLPDGKFDVIFPPDGNEFQEGPPVIFNPEVLDRVYYPLPEKDITEMYIFDEERVIHRVSPPGMDRDNPRNSEYVQEYLENKDLIDEAIGLLAQKLNLPSTKEIVLDRVVRYSNEFNGHIPNLEYLLPNGEDFRGKGTYFHEGLPEIRCYIRDFSRYVPCGCCHYKDDTRFALMFEETLTELLDDQWRLVG